LIHCNATYLNVYVTDNDFHPSEDTVMHTSNKIKEAHNNPSPSNESSDKDCQENIPNKKSKFTIPKVDSELANKNMEKFIRRPLVNPVNVKSVMYNERRKARKRKFTCGFCKGRTFSDSKAFERHYLTHSPHEPLITPCKPPKKRKEDLAPRTYHYIPDCFQHFL